MSYKTIFWDNDGVLVDTERYYLQASREALATISIDLSEAQFATISLRQGRSIFELAEDAGKDRISIEKLREWRNLRYAELLSSEPLLIRGINETIEALSECIEMAIVTSSLKQHFDIIHERTGLLKYMKFSLTREDYKNSKPSAEPYLLALQKSGRNPCEVLVIEDSPRGLAAAKAAGLDCWVIPSKHTSAENFNEANRILNSVSELPNLIL